MDINRPWAKIKKLSKLPARFWLHDLRHTFASLLASSGEVDLYVLQKLLTHKSPLMTQRYAHLVDEARIKATHTLDGILLNALRATDNKKKDVS
jgi:integrase